MKTPLYTLLIPNAYKYTGIRRTNPEVLTVSLDQLASKLGFEIGAQKVLVQLRWDKRLTFLGARALWSQSDKSSGGFTSQRNEVQSLFVKNLEGAPQNSPKVWDEEFKNVSMLVAAVPNNPTLPNFSTLKIEVWIDASNEDFLNLSKLEVLDRNDGMQGKLLKVVREDGKVTGIEFDIGLNLHWITGPYRRAEGRLLVRIVPCLDLPKYNGFLSIDLGNTNSTMAYLDAEAVNAQDIGFINFSSGRDAQQARSIDQALLSAVRLKTFSTRGSKEKISKAVYSIGDAAVLQDTGALILGAKGLLADPKNDALLKINTELGEQEIPKVLPSELLLSSMLQRFYSTQFGFPAPIAATYPTTYSDTEIDRTREAIFRSLRRSTLQETYLPVPGNKSPAANPSQVLSKLLDKWVPREFMLDEATAAAFYFLYRDFVRGPGRLPAAYMEYPNGINLLLYDCGGGTTDIALIHCRLKPVERSKNRKSGDVPKLDDPSNKWNVSVKVLGRTGHRDFGGDNITIATFRVLKVLVANDLSGDFAQLFEVSDDEFSEWMEENYGQVSQWLPTVWTKPSGRPNQPLVEIPLDRDEVTARQEATMAFWLWAEKMKRDLGYVRPKGDEDTLSYPSKDGTEYVNVKTKLGQFIRKRVPNVDPDQVHSAIDNCYNDLDMVRRRVDALIANDIRTTMEAANYLIESRLHVKTRVPFGGHAANSELPPDSTVHWVYVVGKASYYPAIQNSLKTTLNVHALEPERNEAETKSPQGSKKPVRSSVHGRLRFESDVLKACVAGGAVLAARSHRNFPDIKVDFDSELSKRLPYTVGCDTADGFLELYHENQKYDQLSSAWIPVHDKRKGELTVWLYRKWPGREGLKAEAGDLGPWERFLRFDFKDPPVGPIKVEYGYESTNQSMVRRKSFILSDAAGKRERVVGQEVGERQYVSPPQRGNL